MPTRVAIVTQPDHKGLLSGNKPMGMSPDAEPRSFCQGHCDAGDYVAIYELTHLVRVTKVAEVNRV